MFGNRTKSSKWPDLAIWQVAISSDKRPSNFPGVDAGTATTKMLSKKWDTKHCHYVVQAKRKPCHKVPEKYSIKSHYHYFNHVLDLFFPSLRSLSFCPGLRILERTQHLAEHPPGDYYCHIILLSFHLKSFWTAEAAAVTSGGLLLVTVLPKKRTSYGKENT